ncbi:MAG TPA: hypothetical protein VI588_01150 [Candidatus Gracilibacteria bacterium]|nr:hypothetical protein [Candidatus Gracilibacteria bacterium]
MKKTLLTILSFFLIAGCSNGSLDDKEAETDPAIVTSEPAIEQDKFTIASLGFDEKKITAELRETLDMVQAAYDKGDLEYIGEEDVGAGVKRYKLAFKDEEIGPGILISLSPANNFLPSDQDSYSRNGIALEFAGQYIGEGTAKYVHVEAGKINKEELEKKIQDSNVKNSLMKRLIVRHNVSAIPEPDKLKEDSEWCDAPMGGSMPGPSSSENLTDRELAELLYPLIQNSEALFGYVLCDKRDESGEIVSFNITFNVIGELQKNREEALENLNLVEEILDSIKTPEAEEKKQVIEKMKQSKYLAYVPEASATNLPIISATDCINVLVDLSGNECVEINAVVDLREKNDKVVEFEFL